MDINNSSFSRYKSGKSGISRSTSDVKSASDTERIKEASPAARPSSKQITLNEGQIVKGQIIDRRYNEVSIQIEPSHQVITARLSGNVPLSIGEIASFQIVGDPSETLVLKLMPKDNGVSSDIMVQKALSASGQPFTEKNRALVQELLKHNLPIDKQTLQTIIKSSYKNREASPLTLVLMYKNNIPMTQENIKQFEEYQAGTHQLINKIRTITDNLTDLLIPKAASDTNSSTDDMLSISSPVTERPFSQTIPTQSAALENSSLTADSFIDHSAAKQAILLNNDLIGILLEDKVPQEQVSSQSNNMNTPVSMPLIPELSLPISELLNSSERTELVDLLQTFPDSRELMDGIKSGDATLSKTFRFIQEALSQADPKIAQSLLASSEYTNLLQNAFIKKWTLTPDKIAQKTPVNELYETLQKDMKELSRLVEESDVQKMSQIQEPVKDLQDNLQFMKNLNQAFTYLQLPIQLKDKELHSDLYVFTRKRSLKENPESIRVLLHLDMDHLGPLNIHISLERNRIDAKFYLADAQAEQIISTNITSLADALQKKGYQLQSEIFNTYEKPDFSRDFIEETIGDGDVKHYSFDIRT